MAELNTNQAVNALLYLTQQQMYGENTWPYPFDSIDEPTIVDDSFLIMGNDVIQVANVISFANQQNVRIVMMDVNLLSEDNTNISSNYTYQPENAIVTYTGSTPIKKIHIVPKMWYIYYKEADSNVWIINHNLKLDNGNPSTIEFYNKDKTLITPSYTLKVIDTETLQITFNSEALVSGYVLIKS